MRLGKTLGSMGACACATIMVLPAAPARADDHPDAPLPPLSEVRPPLPAAPQPAPVPWQHHIEVGGGLALAQVLSSGGAGTPPMHLQPGVGFHIDLSWQVFRYLRFTGYLVEHAHPFDISGGGLASDTRGPTTGFTGEDVHVYSFGARVSPTLPLGTRARLWLTAGGGFGHYAYPRFTQPTKMVTVQGLTVPQTPTIHESSVNVWEVPLGVGYSIDILPRWLSFHAEVTGSFIPSQAGSALDGGHYVNYTGLLATVNPVPRLDAVFVETIGLSLHL